MKPRKFFQPLLFLALMVVAGGFSQRANAQYQSFFGDSITEYSIGGSLVTKDYDIHFFNVKSYCFNARKSDTVTIYGNTYYHFAYRDFGWEGSDMYAYLREDTTSGRIYRYIPDFDIEQVTCDMSLSVGDTFLMPFNPEGVPSTLSIPNIVDSVWYSDGRKIIHFTDSIELFSGRPYPLLFIEGVGPTFSPFGWGDNEVDCPGGWHSYPILLCVHKDGEQTYMADERAGCEQFPGCKIEDRTSNVFQLYPNPVRNSLNIQFDESSVCKGLLYITNISGHVVYSQQVTGLSLNINVQGLPAGTYVVTYIEKGKSTTQKFVKQ